MTQNIALRSLISGDQAFYKQPDYLNKLAKDIKTAKALPPICQSDTESKIIRIVKKILYALVFPIKIYRFIHALAGSLAYLPAARYKKSFVAEYRSNIYIDDEFKYKRITVMVNGSKIDAMLVGKESTFDNGRWMLHSLGNGEFYENTLQGDEFKEWMHHLDSNALFFNYPGVGASSGVANRRAMSKTYRAMLSLLENNKRGLGATEIIGYGHSLGGGVQADALKSHRLKEDVKYVFIKSRTFSSLAKTATTITDSRFLGFLTFLFGWNMGSVKTKLGVKEIILQTAQVDHYQVLNDSSLIVDDGVIDTEASLGKAFFDYKKTINTTNRLCIGIPEEHNEPLTNIARLAELVVEELYDED